MLTDEEKEQLIITRMKERGIKGLLFLSCPDCGYMVGYLGRDGDFARGECLICGFRVLIPMEGEPIPRRMEDEDTEQ
jgi:DNA-directed RNA polymerase subunit RPC12/RpoP